MAMTCEDDEGCEKPVLARGMCKMHYERWRRSLDGAPLPPRVPKSPKVRPPCSIKGCTKKAAGRGWCAAHYYHWQKWGDPLKSAPPKDVAICAVLECADPVTPKGAKGYCSKHYTRLARYGDPMTVKRITGDDRARFEAYVDRSAGPDACHPWTGSVDSAGYGQIRINGRLLQAHIVGWEFENGPKPSGSDLDHECHNKAVREGRCQPGICEHRRCCNLAHTVPKTRIEHRRDTQQWEMPSWPRRNLTEDDKAMIRDLLAAGHTGRWIAKQFGIHPATVTNVKNGRKR